jgi:hypothetical protein
MLVSKFIRIKFQSVHFLPNNTKGIGVMKMTAFIPSPEQLGAAKKLARGYWQEYFKMAPRFEEMEIWSGSRRKRT